MLKRKPKYAASLPGDWEYTSDTIYANRKPVHHDHMYLASTWVTPELEIDGEIIEYHVMEHDMEWDSDTKWPESALKILSGMI